jgi:predicted site-specific integrase-resolvase
VTTPTAFRAQGLLSTGDIAKMFGVHRTTVWHWMNEGMLKFVQVTPRFRGVKQEDLKRFKSNWIPDTVSSRHESSSAKKPAKKRTKKAPTPVKKKSARKKTRS